MTPTSPLSPGPEGGLSCQGPIQVPFSTCRLQGALGPAWQVARLSLWGAGEVARLRLACRRPVTRSLALPNGVVSDGPALRMNVEADPELPFLVVELAADRSLELLVQAARAPAPNLPRLEASPPAWRAADDWLGLELPWAVLLLRAAGAHPAARRLRLAPACRLLIAVGADEEEAWAAMAAARRGAATADYRRWCASRLESSDPQLGSLMVHALHAAVSSHKTDRRGHFAGLAAGVGYSFPARTYFRDGYWTCQPLLAFRPELVRQQILTLAKGVQDDGEAPSAFVTQQNQVCWSRLRQDQPQVHRRPEDWWSDHFDSPLYLVLLVAGYVGVTGDRDVLFSQVGGRPLQKVLEAIGKRYLGLALERGLPLKPRHDRDWADNVVRSGLVAYDCFLYLAVLRALASLSSSGPEPWQQAYRRGLEALEQLWLPDRQHYADYLALDGWVETHLTVDSCVGCWLKVVPPHRHQALVDSILRCLVTASNPQQPYGDWGIMSCFPPYGRRQDLRAKSAFPYRYHNGADWPLWDGVLAAVLLRDRRPGWRYPLLRWWTYGMERGWPEPVEYYSPPWGRGSPLQAWSGMAAAAMAIACGWSPSGSHRFRPPPFSARAIRGLTTSSGPLDLELRGQKAMPLQHHARWNSAAGS